jgi:hypothetical protein
MLRPRGCGCAVSTATAAADTPPMDTADSAQQGKNQNLSPALARALARKQAAQRAASGPGAVSPSPPLPEAATPSPQPSLDDEEPLAAEVEAQVRLFGKCSRLATL